MAVQAIFEGLQNTGKKVHHITSFDEALERIQEAIVYRKFAGEGETPTYNPVRSFRKCLDVLSDAISLASENKSSLSIGDKRKLLNILNETYFSGQWCAYEETWSNYNSEIFPKTEEYEEFQVELDEEDVSFLEVEIIKNEITQGDALAASVDYFNSIHKLFEVAENLVFRGLSDDDRKENFGADYGEHCRLRSVWNIRSAERLTALGRVDEARSRGAASYPWAERAYSIYATDPTNLQLLKRVSVALLDACTAAEKFDEGLKVVDKIISDLNEKIKISETNPKMPFMVACTHAASINLICEYLKKSQSELSPTSEDNLKIKVQNAWKAAVKLLEEDKCDFKIIEIEFKKTLELVQSLGFEKGKTLQGIFGQASS